MNIDPIVVKVLETVKSHELSTGAYAKWTIPEPGRNMGVNEYGCADAANLLYTVGAPVRDPAERAKWVETMQNMQSPDTGLFSEPTHHPFHTTAHCVAALELFDALPRYELTEMKKYLDTEKLHELLESLDWDHNPWPMSHRGAGLFAALTITRSASLAWQNDYFQWLKEHCDPEYGMSYRGRIGADIPAHHMCGWFHYLFNHACARRPIPYAEKLIDSCIEMYDRNEMGAPFGVSCGFMEIDWVFCLNRASRQTAYRREEIRDRLSRFAKGYVDYLLNAAPKTDKSFDDLHMLFGAMCALSELQTALPGEYLSTVPLKIVLDRRPFI